MKYYVEGKTFEWLTDKEKIEIEENKRREEQTAKKKEKQAKLEKIDPKKAQIRKEIMESTDPSMDEMGTLSWIEILPGGPVGPQIFREERSIRITKRQKMLIDAGIIDKNDIYKEKMKKIRQQEKAEWEREIGKIMIDPRLDCEAKFYIYTTEDEPSEGIICSESKHREHYYVTGTERQRILWRKGVLPESDVKRLIEEAKKKAIAEQEKSHISLGTIKSAISKIVSRKGKNDKEDR